MTEKNIDFGRCLVLEELGPATPTELKTAGRDQGVSS
jgi:hypothetical protein